MPVGAVPSGTVTFLFTDMEGSTRSWEDHPDAMRVAVERHDAIVRDAVGDHGGYVFSTAGDAFAAAFARAGDAITAARAAQVALAAERWPDGAVVRVRMGIHTGEAQERDGDYFGPVLNRAARIMGAGHGGQVLVSATTVALLDGEVLVDLGEHRLKDLSQPLHLFQLGADEFPEIATLGRGGAGLPVQRTELLGRADDVAAIVELLSRHRLVTLVGFGGIGKTRLALAAAAELADRFRRGVHFVDLAPITDGSLVGLTALEAVGIAAVGADPGRSVHERAASMLAGHDVLLVVDNCEHVIDDVVEFVDHVLELSDAPVVLATSREALEIDGERRYRVRPLEIGDAGAPSPAVELFVERAAAAGADPSAADPAVGIICRRLDGVPLAIELAAARTSLMSVSELAGRIDRQLDVLASRRRRGRHRSLEAVLEWSWDLLDDDVADLLLQLAVFTGGWTLRAAEAICDGGATVLDRLDALVASSLVEVNDHPPETRFSMLEPVRQFAAARLEVDPRHDRLRDRHLEWWIEHATGRPVGEQWFSARWAAEVDDEFDNFRAVVTHAVGIGRLDAAAGLLGATHAFAMDSLRSLELEFLVSSVLAEHPDPPARLWLASTINLLGLGDYHLARQRCEIALGRAPAQGDVACEAWAADWMAATLANSDPGRAGALADAAIATAREVGDSELLVATLAWTAMVAYIADDVAGALERFDEAEGLSSPQWSIATSHLHRSRAFVALDLPEVGDPDELFDASIAAAPTRGLHQRFSAFYHAFPRAREGDVQAVTALLDEAFELAVSTDGSNAYTDPAVAAAELLEVLRHPDEAATIIAALYRQRFTFPELYHRFLRARDRLPDVPPPNRRLTTPELRDVIDTQLDVARSAPLAPS